VRKRLVHDDPDERSYFFPSGVCDIGGAHSQSVTYSNSISFESLSFTYTQTGNENDIEDVVIAVDAEKPRVFSENSARIGSSSVTLKFSILRESC
jgi:hypothetical protein